MAMSQTQIKKEPLSNSAFYMWRCVIALAHADGLVQQAERDYLERIFTRMDSLGSLTPEQKASFAADLAAPGGQSIPELLSHINEPVWRSQLIYFGYLLARADGVLDPREEDILKKLHADQLSSLDMGQIRGQVQAAVDDEMFKHSLEMQKLAPEKGFLIPFLDRQLARLGLDLLDNEV